MRRFALLAIGRNRPGIVAAVTGAMLGHGVNVEDSQMTILHGHFTMVLILGVPAEADVDRLRDDLAACPLDSLALREVEDVGPASEPSHIVTVYGSDHPGIVHAVSIALTERGIDITDLNSRLIEEGAPLYVLMLEIALPPGTDEEEVGEALAGVAGREGVEVSLRRLDRDEL